MGYTTLQRFKSKYFGNKNYNPNKYKPKPLIRKKYVRKPMAKTQIVKICKNEIAKQVENKKTPAAQAVAPVCAISAIGVPTWYTLGNWHTSVWKVPQGVGQAQRIANKIKMKKWIIKGQIIPNYPGIAFTESAFLARSYQGYITLFFGRRNDTGAIDGSLFQLLDNGASSLAPAGSSTEMMLPINKEVYKVYWKKTFKMGASYGPNASAISE